MSTSTKCFHKSRSTAANLPLLRENNIWIGEDLAAQSQDEKVPPINSNASEEVLDQFDDRLLYCEACRNGGFSDSWAGGFITRCTIKDGQKIRLMDAQYDGEHLTFALRMLHCYQDTKDISFGFVNQDGSIHPGFRLLATGHVPMIFPAQGSDKLVLQPSKATTVSEEKRKVQGSQAVLTASRSDTKPKDNENVSRKPDEHFERCQSSIPPITTSITETINPTGSTICSEENNQVLARPFNTLADSTTPTGTPPYSELLPSITREQDDDDRRSLQTPNTHLQRNIMARNSPLSASTERIECAASFVGPGQQNFPLAAHTTEIVARSDLVPHGSQSSDCRDTAGTPIWCKNDVWGNDIGESMVFGNTPTLAYPIKLSALSQPVWFCPDPSCNRHYNARQEGPEPFQHASLLRQHAINVHPPWPLPSSSMLSSARIIRDGEFTMNALQDGFTRAEFARAGPIPDRQIVTRPASLGPTPAEAISFAAAPKLPQAVQPSSTSNAFHREETDSILGSDDDNHSDHAMGVSANFVVSSNIPKNRAYISPWASMPESAGSSHPSQFTEWAQNPSSNTALQPEPLHWPEARSGGRACSSCKTRKVKCGKEKPSCAFCINRSLQCIYPGKEEVSSDSYDSPSESTTNVARQKVPNISALENEPPHDIGIQRPGDGRDDDDDDNDDDDDDEEKLLAEIEAMEKEEQLKQEQRSKEEEELIRVAEEKRKMLAAELERAEFEKNRLKREAVQRLREEKIRRKAAIAEAAREYETKREALKRKHEEEHGELMRKKQKVEEERRQYERRSSGIR